METSTRTDPIPDAWLMPCHRPALHFHDSSGQEVSVSYLTIEIPTTLAEILTYLRSQPEQAVLVGMGNPTQFVRAMSVHGHLRLHHDSENCEVHAWR